MAETHPLYTFILAHYNQNKYIFEALDSILSQTYSNIEIIVMDDCSDVFDVAEIRNYIDDHKGANITSINVLRNEENMGTVRSMNKAIKAATGEFIQLFASDDRMHDKDVATNFVREFMKIGETAEILCAMALIMDEVLTPPGEYHLPLRAHERFNTMDAQAQYGSMVFGCRWAMGATCVRADLYRKTGGFSEKYVCIEDWSFYLYLTRNGIKAYTVDFTALDHRDGGISRTVFDPNASHSNIYQQDILCIMETEILPYLKNFPIKTQQALIGRYLEEYQTLMKIGGVRKKWRGVHFWKYSKKIVIWRFLATWRESNNMLIDKSLRVVWMTAIVFFIALGARHGVGIDGSGWLCERIWLDAGAAILSVVLLCAMAFLVVNLVVWLAYKIYRLKRES